MNQKILTLSVLFLLCDQISKIIINLFLEIGEVFVIFKNFLSFTNVTNSGAAFSILEGNTLFLIILSIVIMVFLFNMRKEFKDCRINSIAFGLLFGGICGNFSDRLFLGNVRDFIKVNIFDYNFPIFNLADIFIVFGVIILMISLIRGEDRVENCSKRIR